ncbi:MAG: HNH endonuclease [Oligoflexia bacterium]|nr:HNH endonuclease [Oligoflexia bacterium]
MSLSDKIAVKSQKKTKPLTNNQINQETFNKPTEYATWDIWFMILIFFLGIGIGYFFRRPRFKSRTKVSGYVRRRKFLGRDKFEHREVAEKILGRPLAPGEVVHHINGRPWDNRPENLCAMDHLDHDRYHEWYKYIHKTYGKYPRRETQLRKLRDHFNGILLVDILKRKSKAG